MPPYNSDEYRLAPISFTFVLEVRTATGVLYFCAKTYILFVLQFIFCSSLGRDPFMVQYEDITMFYSLFRYCLLLTTGTLLQIFMNFVYFLGF